MRILTVLKSAGVLLIALVTVIGAKAETMGGEAPVIWVALGDSRPLKRMAPGSTLEGTLERSIYWRDTELFPKGSTVRLVVDRMESRKKLHTVDDRPFVIHLFAPRHEEVARFRSVTILVPDGAEVPLRATFIALAQRAELRAVTAKRPAKALAEVADPVDHIGHRSRPVHPWVLALQAEPQDTTFAALAVEHTRGQATPAACPQPCTIADGTRMPLVLLESLSASKNLQGHTFRAVLLEPVLVGSAIAIPQGSIFFGVLAQRVPPRRLYRPGSLNLSFTGIVLPNGASGAIAASLVAAEVDRGTHMTMDSEGKIHAQRPGTLRFLLDFGVTGGISKISDDTTQLVIEAISSTATDASTAGIAKVAAMSATAIFLLTRHGRDVILPAYTEMDVSLTRSVSLEDVRPATKSLH